jgi:nitrite reductase/ring-hydroxylating ferredoxin subunit
MMNKTVSERASSGRPRFPFPRYPTGWFQIGWSEDVAVGQVVPMTRFGKELVVFRRSDGVIKVLDAYCPHMGAHLGHGGVLKDDELVCPFHAWQFNGDGACTTIPYAQKVPPRAKVDCWPVNEVNGAIMVWHDAEKRPPTWEIPDLPEFSSDKWSTAWHRVWRIRTHNQEMAENMVDVAHFKYLHGTKNMPPAEISVEGPLFKVKAITVMETAHGEVEGNLDVSAYGFGFSVNRFSGLVETLLIGAVCPVDDEYVDVRFSFVVKKFGGRDITEGIGRAFVAEIARQLEQDTPVWENKIYIDPPLLCDGDGPIGRFRVWCKQFYPDSSVREAYQAFFGRPMAGSGEGA